MSYFADFDGILESSICDFELCGLAAFRNYYKFISFTTKTIIDTPAICYSRICQFARHLSDDPDPSYDFFKFDTSTASFVAIDKRMKKQKLMTNLAAELLKDQIMNLEIKQGIAQKTHPIVLLDVDCFLYRLKQVKNLLQSKTSIILVSLYVMNQLDALKKGQDKVNISAREANRYLEQRFKYPSSFLIGQTPKQELQPIDPSIFIPSTYREIITCSLYYQNRCRSFEQAFTIITSNEELKNLAMSLKIDVYTISEWMDKCMKK